MPTATRKTESQNDLQQLTTESQNEVSRELDNKSALEIARIINREDEKVAKAVRRALPEIGHAIDAIADAIRKGGRLIYVGAGTSGRIAALDASEIPPTYNTNPETVQYVMAGGARALGTASEANEDSRELGEADMSKRRPTNRDVVVGLAASGRTPYTVAAVEFARARGATTVAVTCNPDSALANAVDVPIVVEVGPEVISGSTRMKAGTAQKMVLNMLTTGAMTRLGYVYGNLMVNVSMKNKKLVERAIGILQKATGVDRELAQHALKSSTGSVPVALVMIKTGLNARQAEQRLKAFNGHVRRAI
ncbi:MAG TPA: N-acetylmuramic acid 6-phosphate etherase, partial [Terriglobales bacterium]